MQNEFQVCGDFCLWFSQSVTHSRRKKKDFTKPLQDFFTSPDIPLSLPSDLRRTLQDFAAEYGPKTSAEAGKSANAELTKLWEKYVRDDSQKVGSFVGVLKELSAVIPPTGALWNWWQSGGVCRVLTTGGYDDSVVADARQFMIDAVVVDEDGNGLEGRGTLSKRILGDLLGIYLAQICSVESGSGSNTQEAIMALGHKRPKVLFTTLNEMILVSDTRIQALELLTAFLRRQAPHIYLVVDTPLLQSLLKCLMNDTSTMVLSIALKALIMFLPHVAGALPSDLPRLFLVYSRILCWERFSPLSTQDERNAVTDNRTENAVDENGRDPGDVGFDGSWEVLRPTPGIIEAETPELMTYFTYLYGLYPLNLMSYIRKPRRYLKGADFPGAEAFDLDPKIIGERTNHFRQVHLLHPNFYGSTVEEESAEAKWSRMDPSEVVGECHGLFVNNLAQVPNTGRPPSRERIVEASTPSPSAVPPGEISEQGSPLGSSFLSTSSARDIEISSAKLEAGVEGWNIDDEGSKSRFQVKRPALVIRSPSIDRRGAQTVSNPPTTGSLLSPPSSDPRQLQQEVQLLRSELNFERWHKAQYSAHISHITRKNVKDAMTEAEALNLINANKALKRQLEHLRKAREATAKDMDLTRKHAKTLESTMAERFRKLKSLHEQSRDDEGELQKLRTEIPKYRELLVDSEARELTAAHELEIARTELTSLKAMTERVEQLESEGDRYQQREFEHRTTAKREEILRSEVQRLKWQKNSNDWREDDSDMRSSVRPCAASDDFIDRVSAACEADRLHPKAGLVWGTGMKAK